MHWAYHVLCARQASALRVEVMEQWDPPQEMILRYYDIRERWYREPREVSRAVHIGAVYLRGVSR